MNKAAELGASQSKLPAAAHARDTDRLWQRSIANGVKNVAFTAYLMFFDNQLIGAPAAIVSAAMR
jgi:hypothetical protein